MAEANADQAAFWGGDAGHTWVAQQAAMDALLTPVLDCVLARADLQVGQRVLDVGCGTGQSTLAAGRMVGPSGAVTGADVSEPMLALARSRAAGLPRVGFDCVDVSDHAFAVPYDRVISRFGVMFFADTTAAFANIAAAMARRGRLTFATWGAIDGNPWFTLPARVGREMFGPVPKSDPDAPGPFALRDRPVVEDMLHTAGFQQVRSEALEMHLTLDAGPAAIAELCMHIGPAARTVSHFELGAEDRTRLVTRLTDAFAVLPDHKVPAQINIFTAHRP